MLEGKIQKQIIAFLKRKKVYHFRFQAQSNINGVPDIICVYKGLFIGLELKQKNGRATDLQKRKLDAINDAGGIGLIIYNKWEVELLFNMLDEYENDLFGEMTVLTFRNRYNDRREYERNKAFKE